MRIKKRITELQTGFIDFIVIDLTSNEVSQPAEVDPENESISTTIQEERLGEQQMKEKKVSKKKSRCIKVSKFIPS